MWLGEAAKVSTALLRCRCTQQTLGPAGWGPRKPSMYRRLLRFVFFFFGFFFFFWGGVCGCFSLLFFFLSIDAFTTAVSVIFFGQKVKKKTPPSFIPLALGKLIPAPHSTSSNAHCLPGQEAARSDVCSADVSAAPAQRAERAAERQRDPGSALAIPIEFTSSCPTIPASKAQAMWVIAILTRTRQKIGHPGRYAGT